MIDSNSEVLSTSLSIYFILLIPVVLVIYFFFKYPSFVLKKKNEKKISLAKENDRVVLHNGKEGIVLSNDKRGFLEIKFDDGKALQYAYWAIKDIIE